MTAPTARPDRLAADTAMGPVTLDVADLAGMTAFYRDVITLQVLSEEGPVVTLGRGRTPIVILRHSPQLRHAAPGSAGLFHTAILFPTQTDLAAVLASVAQKAPQRFTGSADHLVSQAFYLDDPEGNGIELYWDRDRTQWSWVHGQVEMATLYLDPNDFLRQHLTPQALEEPGTSDAEVGHVHLSVGDTRTAKEFYVDRLGFDTTAELGNQALFVSAGGYHHHMAMNVWNSRGAGRRFPTLGLGQVDIELPTGDDVGELAERMRHYGVQAADDGRTVSFEDPWANLIRVTVAGS
ncbi:VOC family protein [Ornithinimicrobium humiphilum]|uniref:Catechol 2,3-dioxygenase n=1 Tax=Ornithinimicrobium humiphilum TaxID=125288 RepID=A0A543KND3_9MICO|nr:VOC family protein [Ornithinimicrobium humiphilum]TQM96581.1 catechol 2,3-dioxygenase [Ornithinimicrobium humiphilum]